MKNKEMIVRLAVTGVLAGAAVGVALYLLKKQKQKKRLAVVADAGYETAYDIHYPLKYKG